MTHYPKSNYKPHTSMNTKYYYAIGTKVLCSNKEAIKIEFDNSGQIRSLEFEISASVTRIE